MDQLTKTATSKRGLFLSTYRQQEWSLPDNIIYYITKNPSSPKCYQKMIQNCKHFFIKNPILVVPYFYLEYQNNRWDAHSDGRLVDINRITSKIWASFRISIGSREPIESHVLSSIIPKFYKSDVKELDLWSQDISLNDLKFVASECELVRFTSVAVMKENGSVIPLENIIKSLPNVKIFDYNFEYAGDPSTEVISSKTVFELLRIPHFSNLTDFALFDIPEAFDIETFYDYLKKNKNTTISLYFREELPDAYKIRLQAIVDEILEHGCREYKPPYIEFHGMTPSSREKMRKLRDSS